ncbi:MAG: hypothetical protein WAW92_00985, partial [Minisyncoccia bacterium]
MDHLEKAKVYENENLECRLVLGFSIDREQLGNNYFFIRYFYSCIFLLKYAIQPYKNSNKGCILLEKLYFFMFFFSIFSCGKDTAQEVQKVQEKRQSPE